MKKGENNHTNPNPYHPKPIHNPKMTKNQLKTNSNFSSRNHFPSNHHQSVNRNIRKPLFRREPAKKTTPNLILVTGLSKRQDDNKFQKLVQAIREIEFRSSKSELLQNSRLWNSFSIKQLKKHVEEIITLNKQSMAIIRRLLETVENQKSQIHKFNSKPQKPNKKVQGPAQDTKKTQVNLNNTRSKKIKQPSLSIRAPLQKQSQVPNQGKPRIGNLQKSSYFNNHLGSSLIGLNDSFARLNKQKILSFQSNNVESKPHKKMPIGSLLATNLDISEAFDTYKDFQNYRDDSRAKSKQKNDKIETLEKKIETLEAKLSQYASKSFSISEIQKQTEDRYQSLVKRNNQLKTENKFVKQLNIIYKELIDQNRDDQTDAFKAFQGKLRKSLSPGLYQNNLQSLRPGEYSLNKDKQTFRGNWKQMLQKKIEVIREIQKKRKKLDHPISKQSNFVTLKASGFNRNIKRNSSEPKIKVQDKNTLTLSKKKVHYDSFQVFFKKQATGQHLKDLSGRPSELEAKRSSLEPDKGKLKHFNFKKWKKKKPRFFPLIKKISAKNNKKRPKFDRLNKTMAYTKEKNVKKKRANVYTDNTSSSNNFSIYKPKSVSKQSTFRSKLDTESSLLFKSSVSKPKPAKQFYTRKKKERTCLTLGNKLNVAFSKKVEAKPKSKFSVPSRPFIGV